MQTLLHSQQICTNPFLLNINIENPKTLNDWLSIYLDDISKEITINTFNNYNSYIFRHIVPVLGEYKLTELTAPIRCV